MRMTREEAIKMLTAKAECMTRDTSGMDEDCNSHNCGECNLCYEQGNMGEQIEYLHMAIKALEEPQWIPCSERLPEEYGEYRITWTTSASKKRFIGDSEYEITGEWDSENDRFRGEWLLDEYIKNYPDVKVLAWKPLEEPWDGGDAE